MTSNSAKYYGGGIYSNGSSLSVSGCVLSGNTATSDGGGIYVQDGGSATVTDSTLSYNSAGAYGGGIYGEAGSTVTVIGSRLFYNSATADGGGIYNLGSLSVGTSKFHGNTPDDIAGGYNDLGGNSRITV